MSIEKELLIKLQIDASSAKRSTDAQMIGLAKLQKAGVDYSNSLERAHKKVADASEKAAKKSLDAAKKTAEDAARAWEKSEGRAADAAVKAVGVRARENLKAANDAVRNTEKAIQAQIRADAKATASAQRAAQQKIAAVNRVAIAEANAATATDKLVAAAGNVAGSFIGIGAVISAFSSLSNEIGKTNETAAEFAQTLLKTKDDLKEIATLKGFAFADDAVVKQMVGFTKATGMSMGKANDFQRQLFGSAAGGLDKKHVDQETLDKAAIMTGRAANRQTNDLGTRGDLVGFLTQVKDYKHKDGKEVSSDDAAKAIASDAEGVRLALTEGRGDDAPLTKALLDVSGSLVGEGHAVPDIKPMAAMLGVASLSAGPMKADERIRQLASAVYGSTPKQVEYLKEKFKVEESDDFEARVNKIIPKLQTKKAEGRDLNTYLVEEGFNQEQARGLLEGESNFKLYNTRLARSRNPANGDKINADSDKFDNSALGKKQKGEAALLGAKLEIGKRREALEAELPGAEADLVGGGLGTDLSYLPGSALRLLSSGFTTKGDTVRKEQRALERLRAKSGIQGYSPQEIAIGAVTDPVAGYARLSASGQSADAAQFYQAIIDLNRKQLEEAQKANAAKNAPAAPPAAGLPQAPPVQAGPAPPMRRPHAGGP